MRRIILIVLFILIPSLCWGTTYYIDFVGGSDTNAGTSTGAPWKHIPGTRNTGDTDWQSTCWGSGCPGTPTIASTAKVVAGTIFKLKSGTSHTSANGGKILLNSTYYNTSYVLTNPVTFQRDTTWGTGSVTFDGTGITTGGSGFGLIHVANIGGFVFDGVAGVSNTYDGFIIKNSKDGGIAFYMNTTGILEGGKFYYIKFQDSFTDWPSGTGQGYLNMAGDQYSTVEFQNSVIDHCEISGNSSQVDGFFFATAATNTTVSNSVVYNLVGTDENDYGNGFFAVNGQITFINCTAYNNSKGFDLGEYNGADVDITYKVINCAAYENTWGINANGQGKAGVPYGGTIKFYIINNIIRDNSHQGSNFYAGPFNLYLVHNVYDNNGTSPMPGGESANIRITPDNNTDEIINAYLYNNIFYKPGSTGTRNYFNSLFQTASAGNEFNLYSDFNSWVQNSTELFAWWSFSVDGEPYWTYDADGPGKASGTWYTYYGGSTTPPPNGQLGHYHADANSKGTGATDTTLPPFTDVTNHVYTLTTSYTGTNLSGKPWYTSEMGTDRAGRTRSGWDIGAYEYVYPSISGVTISGSSIK